MPRLAAKRVPPTSQRSRRRECGSRIAHRRTRPVADKRWRLVSGCVARSSFSLRISASIGDPLSLHRETRLIGRRAPSNAWPPIFFHANGIRKQKSAPTDAFILVAPCLAALRARQASDKHLAYHGRRDPRRSHAPSRPALFAPMAWSASRVMIMALASAAPSGSTP